MPSPIYNDPKVYIALSIVGLLIGSFLAYIEQMEYRRATDLAEGVITGYSYGGGTHWLAHPRIRYVFKVDEKDFRGSQKLTFWSYSTVEEKYPKDKIVPVWYNPNNPTISFLEMRIGDWPIFIWGISILALIINVCREIRDRREIAQENMEMQESSSAN